MLYARAKLSSLFLLCLNVLARLQVWWAHYKEYIHQQRLELLGENCIVRVVQYDLENSKKTVWYNLGWIDVLCVMMNDWLSAQYTVMLLNEFHAERKSHIIYEVTMADGTIALVRDRYVHDHAMQEKPQHHMGAQKHKYIYCKFDDSREEITNYINKRVNSLNTDLSLRAKDLYTILYLNSHKSVTGKRAPCVNENIFRAMHGTTLELHVFQEDDVVILC